MKCIKMLVVLAFFTVWFTPLTLTIHAASKSIKVRSSSELKNDTSRVARMMDAAYKYINTKESDLTKARAYIDTAVTICKEERLEIPSRLSLLLAQYSLATGEYKRASDYAEKALQASGERGEKEIHAHSLVFLGSYYSRTGFFNESIEYFQQAIDYSKRNRVMGVAPRIYFLLARDVYQRLGDWPRHNQSLENVIKESIAENDTSFLVRGYHYLGTRYADTARAVRNFRLADSLLKKSLSIAMKRKDTAFIAASLANMGWNFYGEMQLDSSWQYYKRSLSYAIPGNEYSTSANAYGNLGTIYRDLGDIKTSLSYYEKAIEIARKVKDWYSLEWTYLDLTNIYLNLNDSAKAFRNYVLHKQFSDSLKLLWNMQGLSDAKLSYEISSHKKEVELLSLRVKNQRLMIYGFSGLIVLSLALGILLFRASRLKAKRRISEMNRKISEITQANLRQQMNPHFIFNTLNSIQYYMYQHDKLATNNYLTKFSSLMRKVLENSQHPSVTLHDELEALNLYLDLEKIRFKDKFDYTITVDEEIDTLMFKVPTMLIQPYVENSICHGLMPAVGKGLVNIDLKLNETYIKCVIEDNGIGREAAQKLREKSEKNHNSLGTQIVASRLELVNSLYGTSLKTIYTDLKNDNGEPSGTRVEIHIPIIT